MTPSVRYPSGPVTPHGAYHILHDRIPQVTLRSYDDTAVFHLMGGLAIPDRTIPERVELKSIKGLIPPWQTIDQKGATQDGTTFVDALYDPIEVTLETKARGRTPAYTRRVLRDLIASLDAKQESELSWFTHEMGRWWAKVRWFKTPDDDIDAVSSNVQDLSLRLRADTGFYQSYQNVDDFRFSYASSSDAFDTDDADDLGTGWTINYSGGSGIIFVDSGQIKSTLAGGRTAVARRVGYTSTTNNQVAEIQIGSIGQWYYPPDTYVDIWLRMANAGTPGDDGVRLRIYRHKLRVSYFIAGVETVLRERVLQIPPQARDKFTFVAGKEGDERSFRVLRGGATLMNFKEVGTGSQLGASFRSAGLGLRADSSTLPANIRDWTTGDNSTIAQSGFLRRINAGDQPMFDRYTCFGPGTFRFANGPGSSDMIEFGPLIAGQVAQIRTDPRKRGVVDLSSTPTTPQDETFWLSALLDFLSFGTANNSSPLLGVIQSVFGIFSGASAPVPPQGNMYSLLHGRFSDDAAIPAKPVGNPAQVHHVKVEIDDGNADSQIIVAGTPLRRFPY